MGVVSFFMNAVSRVEHVHVIEIRIVVPNRVTDSNERFVIDATQKLESVDNRKPSIVKDHRSLSEIYGSLLSSRDGERQLSQKTISDNHSVLRRFEEWACSTGIDCGDEPIRLLEIKSILRDFAVHIRSQPKGNSASMATKAIGVITKLTNACDEHGMLKRRAERISKSAVNLIRPRTECQRRIKGIPVSVEELHAMMAVLHECKWPRLGSAKPEIFWKTSLLSHYMYGFRSQDWFACRGSEKKGLLWSGIMDDAQCPLIKDLHNGPGWAWYLVHKTAKKNEAADRPSDVLIPLSSSMRSLIEMFRGIDEKRVFPTVNNSRTYSEEFARILNRAGLSDDARRKEGKPIIRLSLGQRNIASFRKGCAAWWSEKVGRPAASYLLHHSLAEEGVSKTTTDSYLQSESVLRQIVQHIETFPA